MRPINFVVGCLCLGYCISTFHEYPGLAFFNGLLAIGNLYYAFKPPFKQ